MKKKYFTEEEKRIAKNTQEKKYYDKIKKPPLSDEQKEVLKKESSEKRKKYVKEYYLKNKDKFKEYDKEYFKNNKGVKQKKNNERYKKRRNEEPLYKLITNIKRNIRMAIKKNGLKKNSKTYEILGCSYDELKQHLESKFESWMNWNNYGLYNGEEGYGWDIDHKVPISSDKTYNGIIRLSHYTNLQPLCSYNNRVIKRNKLN